MPSRRRLLRTCGVGLGLGLAGCLGTGGESPDATPAGTTSATETPPATDPGTTTETETTTPTTTRSPPTVEEVDPAAVAERGVPVVPTVESTDAKPFRAFAVGDRDGVANPDDNLPHQLWVWNDVDRKREIAIALTTGGTTVLDERDEFPARAALAVELADPRPYELTVRAGDRGQTVEVPRSQFDCNASATDVAVREDEIEDATITTELACDTATASGS